MANYEMRVAGFKDTLQVDDGGMLKTKWEEYKTKKIKDELVEIKGWAGMLSDIKSFRNTQNSNSENTYSEQSENQYKKDLYAFRSMPVEKKAKRLGFFRLMYYGFTEKKSEEVLTNSGKPLEELAEAIQKKFFSENPKRMFCDPNLFKPLIKSEKCENAVMRIVENQIRQDKFATLHL